MVRQRSRALGARLAALGLAGFTTIVSSPARGQDNELDVAAQFFEAGAAAARKREFRVCAEAFTEAHKRAPHGATIYNAALCWDGAKEAARAANDYDEALKLGNLSSQQKKQAEKRLGQLKKELGQVEVAEPQGVRASVGPISQRPIPFTTYLPSGEHEIRAEGPDGTIVTRTVEVSAGEMKRVEVAIEKPESPTPEKQVEIVEQPASSSFQRTTAWVLVGASVVAAGAGTAYYAAAITARDEFEASNRKDSDARQRAIDRYSVARALWIGAGVAAAAGVTLLVTAPKSKSEPQAALRIHPTGVSASLSF